MSKKNENDAETVSIQTPQFSKEQILQSKRYHQRRDALGFLLQDGKSYSDTDITTILNDYMRKEVK